MEENKQDGVQIDLNPEAAAPNAPSMPPVEEVQLTDEQKRNLATRMMQALAATKNRSLSEKSKMATEAGLMGGNREYRRKMLKSMAPAARRAIKREMALAQRKIA